MDVTDASTECDRILDEVGSAVIADRAFLEDVLLGFVARGHVLMEDVPGTGKTLTARTVADAVGLSFSRVQFTPDLLPADITGTHVFNERERTFEFNEGPLFANVVLADEINRAPPKTLVPVTSLGRRSGVNCTRENSSPRAVASVRAVSVLPVPGTSSTRTCPRASRATSSRSKKTVSPTTASPTASTTSPQTSPAASTLIRSLSIPSEGGGGAKTSRCRTDCCTSSPHRPFGGGRRDTRV